VSMRVLQADFVNAKHVRQFKNSQQGFSLKISFPSNMHDCDLPNTFEADFTISSSVSVNEQQPMKR
jgi:hypothetical protein